MKISDKISLITTRKVSIEGFVASSFDDIDECFQIKVVLKRVRISAENIRLEKRGLNFEKKKAYRNFTRYISKKLIRKIYMLA